MLPGAEELAPGVHSWVTHYPEWGHDVSSVAIGDEHGLVLVDPLAPAGRGEARRFWRGLDAVAGKARVDVVLTLHYHLRSAPDVVERYSATLWAPVRTAAKLRVPVDRAFEPGDELPGSLVAYASGRDDEVVLWHPPSRTLISGDALLGGVRKPYRVCPPSWLPAGVTRADVARTLAPLATLPVEVLLPLHGPPVTDGAAAALAAALDEAGG